VSNLTFERYLQTVQFPKLLKDLGVPNVEALTEQIKHFTEKEAEKRDEIVLGYFGAKGVERIVNSITNGLVSPPKLTENAEILDVGAGTGFFTTKIAQKLRKELPNASFYAMDITPAMLRVLVKKTTGILPFLGTAENVSASIKFARKHLEIPEKFDAVYSTLTLHHCLDIRKVFRSICEVLKANGKAVIVDLCEHSFVEFKEEMGDIHLGFQPEQVKEAVSKYFPRVQIEKMSGICCESSGRSAELFIAYMTT
jgi:ubiquinone/menaquinone biosynthesis C-methylase UbiE